MIFCNPRWFALGNLHVIALVVSVILILCPSTLSASSKLPPFRQADCRVFRERLFQHTWESFYDWRHSTRLGIAGLALFWIGLPGIPLGIAAIWLGRRMQTDVLNAMIKSGVNKDNWEQVNKYCADILRDRTLKNVRFDGRNTTAIILGGLAVALSAIVLCTQGCLGGLAFCMRKRASGRKDRETADDSDDTGDTRRV